MFGIAGPVFNNSVSIFANLNWPAVNGDDLAKKFNLKEVTFLNDFAANGYGVLSNIKENDHYIRLNNNEVDPRGPIGMIGAGTGLGHGYLVKNRSGKYYHVFASEGGHQDFAPQTELDWRYSKYLSKFYDVKHVSVERAVAGPAIPVMLQFFIEIEGMSSSIYKTDDEIKNANPKDITRYGLNGECKVCDKVVDYFAELYGNAAGNVALMLLPTGGIYLLGGVSIALKEYIIKKDVFVVRFILIYVMINMIYICNLNANLTLL